MTPTGLITTYFTTQIAMIDYFPPLPKVNYSYLAVDELIFKKRILTSKPTSTSNRNSKQPQHVKEDVISTNSSKTPTEPSKEGVPSYHVPSRIRTPYLEE